MRAEILQCSQYMSVLFSLLIASNGVILGVALRAQSSTVPTASAHMRGSSFIVLMVLPVVSYLISVRYVYLHLGAIRIGKYIDEKLSPHIPGGIGWESWLRDTKPAGREISQRWSDHIAFLGTSILGLAGSAYPLVRGQASPWFWLLWSGCLGLSLLTFKTLRFRSQTRLALSETSTDAA